MKARDLFECAEHGSEPRMVVIVDAELRELSRARDTLRREHEPGRPPIEAYSSPMAVLRRALERRLDVVLVRHRPPELDGVNLLAQMRALHPLGVRLLICDDGDAATLVDAINRAEVWRVLPASQQTGLLVTSVRAGLAEAGLRLEERRLADLMRVRQGTLSAAELEMRRLEGMEPGITHVDWGANGEVLMSDELPTRPIAL